MYNTSTKRLSRIAFSIQKMFKSHNIPGFVSKQHTNIFVRLATYIGSDVFSIENGIDPYQLTSELPIIIYTEDEIREPISYLFFNHL